MSGNWYILIEIEQEGSGDDYFTFNTGGGYSLPLAGTELMVMSEEPAQRNTKGAVIPLEYGELSAGDTPTPTVSGRNFCDVDRDGLDNDEPGISSVQVFLIRTDVSIIQE